MMKRAIVTGLLLLFCEFTAAQKTAESDTMLVPRGREAYEKHLQELNAKYGADRNKGSTERLEPAVRNEARGDAVLPVAPVPLPANLPADGKLRIELLPHGENQFLLQDQIYDRAGLVVALSELQRGHVIDQVVLITTVDRTIQLDHLLELGRVGQALSVATAYQQGREFKTITTTR